MIKIYTAVFFILFTLSSHAQSKRDYHWIFGNDSDGLPTFGALQFDFNTVPFEVGTRDAGLTFDHNNASISDEDGNLLFYTNGCAVATADHTIMMNGDSINAGAFFDTAWLGDCRFGYPGPQDIMILDDPGNERGFYIIHKTIEYDTSTNSGLAVHYLKYTYVDMDGNNGEGAVLEKNIPFYTNVEQGILLAYLTAIKHTNQRDWWILQPIEKENSYLRILLTENGFEKIDTQTAIRPHSEFYSSAAGNSRFSPDGNIYAFYNKEDGLHVFDFDRSTGELSNARSLITAKIDNAYFSSIEFSSNSELLYYMTHDSLWQVDLSYQNLEEGNVFIEEWNGITDPFPTTFFDAALGPDCRIYIRSGSSTQSVNVINKPNERGVACDFVQQGIQFPYTNERGAWPNFPRWRVDEEEKCDSSIVSLFGELVYYRQDLKVYPNPSTGPMTIDLPEDQTTGYLSIIDASGQSILQKEIHQIAARYTIDLSIYPTGLYFIEYIPKENKARRIYTAQVVVD